MINTVYKDICQQTLSQHYSTFLFQKSFYCFETGISLFFFVYEYKFIVYFARSYLRIQLFELLIFYLLPRITRTGSLKNQEKTCSNYQKEYVAKIHFRRHLGVAKLDRILLFAFTVITCPGFLKFPRTQIRLDVTIND